MSRQICMFHPLEQMGKRIGHLRWTRFSFSTFAACFKCPNLFLPFLLILKHFKTANLNHFLAALLSDMKCLLKNSSNFDFSWPIKAWHFLFLRWKVASKCAILNLTCDQANFFFLETLCCNYFTALINTSIQTAIQKLQLWINPPLNNLFLFHKQRTIDVLLNMSVW